VSAAIDAGLKGPKGFETPIAAAKTLHLEMPTILVAHDVAQQQWMVAQTPTAYILDADGVIVDVLEGSEKAKLARAIKKALVG
jgi:hypothetical protein